MYYRVKQGEDLSKTSYKAFEETTEYKYIDYTEGYVGDSWEEVSEEHLIQVFGSNPFNERIKFSRVHQPTNAEVAQMISDLHADLIIVGVI